MRLSTRTALALGIALAAASAFPKAAAAQGLAQIEQERLRVVMPQAERFGPVEGDPPVIRGFASDPATGREVQVGYLFLTSDLPPEERGYNGPIEVLVGLDMQGRLTGMRVISYFESLQSSRGDFLRQRGFQEQFAGKPLSDAFRPRRDLDGVSGATISVAAMARGVRNAARRVALAYLAEERGAEQGAEVDLAELGWVELVDRGLVQKLYMMDRGASRIDVSLIRLRDEAMGRSLLGPAVYDSMIVRLGERAPDHHLWLVGLDGGLEALVNPQALALVRGADTIRFRSPDWVLLGEPRAGAVDAQFRRHAVLLVPHEVDPGEPFTWVMDFGGGLGPYTAEYPGEAPPTLALEPAPAPAPGADAVADAGPEPTAGAEAEADVGEAGEEGAEAGLDVAEGPPPSAGAAPSPLAFDPAQLAFEDDEEETVLARTLAQTSWVRFGLLAGLLVLASVAFFSKRTRLRWVTLGATLVVLGFGGGGFLSVSHLTSALKVGPSVFLEDLPLLLFVVFTVVSTLLWGRVFCGYLCPFGALQDLLERVVPKRFKRELPRAIHERALYVKYGVLALVLLPAAAGSSMLIFQYFEPFGTVFFLSSSILLWTIAAGLLVAAAIVPRFYCRYVCPLGASLALASTVSPFRIRRVEQCTLCKVCEQDCPTGAIRGPHIDFKECVRCNVCEVNLIEKVGVCRHDMGEVRGRLIPLRVAPGKVAGGR